MAIRIKRPQPNALVQNPTAAQWFEPELAAAAARLAELEAHDRFDEGIPVAVSATGHLLQFPFVSFVGDEDQPLVVCFATSEAQQEYLRAFADGDEAAVMAVPVRLVRFWRLPSDHPAMKAVRRNQLVLHDGLLPTFAEYMPGKGMRPLISEQEAADLRLVLSGAVALLERWLENNAERDENGIFVRCNVAGHELRVSAPNPMDALLARMNELPDDDAEGDEGGAP